jgi:uncharacterized UPF0160 family protein
MVLFLLFMMVVVVVYLLRGEREGAWPMADHDFWQMDAVVDVGGTYEPEKMRFDHHQRGFEETFDSSHKTKLSSAGLVYKHFGMEIMAGLMEGHSEENVKLLFMKMYDNMIEELDAVDNGVSCYPNDIQPKFTVSSTLAQRVGRLNPYWNQVQIG